MALLGVAVLAWKYGLDETATPEALAQRLDKMLATLRRALGGKHYVLGEFSYADIAMAAALHFVAPPSEEWMRLGQGTRRTFTRPALAERHRDLLEWRDKLYAERRTGPRA
jgi:glutathione S-transferase